MFIKEVQVVQFIFPLLLNDYYYFFLNLLNPAFLLACCSPSCRGRAGLWSQGCSSRQGHCMKNAVQLWRPKQPQISPPEGSGNIATLYLQKWRPGGTLRETAHARWPGDVCFPLLAANGSGTASCFLETSALTITNIFSQQTLSSGKNAANNKEKKILGIHFPPSLGKSEWTNGSTSFQHQNSCYILYSSFLTLMRTAHGFRLCRDHCTMAKKL